MTRQSCPCETCQSREHHRRAKEQTLREAEARERELAVEQERIFQVRPIWMKAWVGAWGCGSGSSSTSGLLTRQ